MSRWQPIASMVTTAPSIASMSSSLRDGDDLVRLLRHLDLAEHEALARGEGRDHVDRRLARPSSGRSGASVLPSMAITSAGAPVSAATQATKQRWKASASSVAKMIAEVIVRGRAVAKRPEPAQQLELLLAEARDVDEGLRPGQHREQTQQQHLVERIDHLAGLARVRQSLK